MKQNFDNLSYKGTVRDYSHFRIGDSVIIPHDNSLLRRSLSNLFENEKRAMHGHAERIGARLTTTKDRKGTLEIKFADPYERPEEGNQRVQKGTDLFA